MSNRKKTEPRKTVACLGAAGDMGETLARHLARSEHVGKLLLVDLDGDSAARVAAELASTAPCEVISEKVDVLDGGSLRGLLERVDFVANAAGPFFRLGVPTLRVAIETRTPYLDICDDPEPTLEMMNLEAEARAAGVGALIGMGASPGVSNLMAKRAAERLDEVIDCYTAWPLDVAMPGPTDQLMQTEEHLEVSAAVIHLMEQISGTVNGVVGGQLIQVKPLEQITLNYPGLGEGAAVTVGHPEPVTLLRNLGVTGRSANLMLVTRATQQYLKKIGRDIDAGRLSLQQAAEAITKPKILRSLRASMKAWRSQGPGHLPAFFALLKGRKNGVPKTIGCHATTLPRGMDGVTSIPAAIAVDRLLSQPAPPGVHAPESVIDADELLERLRPHCPDPPGRIEEFVPLTEM